jgi:hypothetical protein
MLLAICHAARRRDLLLRKIDLRRFAFTFVFQLEKLALLKVEHAGDNA